MNSTTTKSSTPAAKKRPYQWQTWLPIVQLTTADGYCSQHCTKQSKSVENLQMDGWFNSNHFHTHSLIYRKGSQPRLGRNCGTWWNFKLEFKDKKVIILPMSEAAKQRNQHRNTTVLQWDAPVAHEETCTFGVWDGTSEPVSKDSGAQHAKSHSSWPHAGEKEHQEEELWTALQTKFRTVFQTL